MTIICVITVQNIGQITRHATVSGMQDVNDATTRARPGRAGQPATGDPGEQGQAGLSRSFYTQVEHARQTISVDRAFALANVLGVEMTELFSAFPRSPTPAPTDWVATPAPHPAAPASPIPTPSFLPRSRRCSAL
jgi:hypothetical protein